MTSIVVSNFATGYETDRPAYLINNDAFPVINNAYMWRGRILKKRGVSQLGRLTRTLTTASLGNSPASSTWTFNIFTVLGLAASQPNAQIIAGSTPVLTITDGTDTFTDNGDGTLSGGAGSSIINYSSGAVTLNRTVSTANAFTITFSYYPCLPVMGIEEFNVNFDTPGSANIPTTVFFDTQYSYQFTQRSGPFYDVNFFVATGLPFKWSGTDYQQFWTTNYFGAMWATNNKPGFNFFAISAITVGGTTQITTATDNPLQNGDIVFFNEITGADANLLNYQTAVVTVIDTKNFTVPINTTGKAIDNDGIFQMLTNTIAGQDGIKYYLGDPTGPSLTKGWVNFAPPLSSAASPSYLVGAKIIIPFKNRLLFFGTWTQTSAGSAVFNPNQLVASQAGTPFYANGGLPPNQTADYKSFFQNEVGRGLRLNAPVSQEVMVVNINADVVVVIFENIPLKLYWTGDDSAPFLYQAISSEYGAEATFSGVPLDVGVLSISAYGFTMTTQESTQRIDLKIPDQIFNINKNNNGVQRICVIRDFRNEFIYWTFPNNANSTNNIYKQIPWTYPTTTLAYNYREATWSTFTETYTTYGEFYFTSSYTWATLPYNTWSEWQSPWNFGSTEAKFPLIACGNQQGFIMLRQSSTFEADSQYISAIDISTLTITSPKHNLNDGDFITINNCIGVSDINGITFKISVNPNNADTFVLFLPSDQTAPTGTYLGGGTYSRLTNFYVQTKQFPVAWQYDRKTILGTQRYLLEKTQSGQITVNLFVNESTSLIANDPIYNYYLPYSNVLFTSPEGSDLNLTQGDQSQIWHRIATSVVGDTVQLGFTLSEDQMYTSANQDEFILYAFTLNVRPGPTLAM